LRECCNTQLASCNLQQLIRSSWNYHGISDDCQEKISTGQVSSHLYCSLNNLSSIAPSDWCQPKCQWHASNLWVSNHLKLVAEVSLLEQLKPVDAKAKYQRIDDRIFSNDHLGYLHQRFDASKLEHDKSILEVH
jgi:hypothetical protein